MPAQRQMLLAFLAIAYLAGMPYAFGEAHAAGLEQIRDHYQIIVIAVVAGVSLRTYSGIIGKPKGQIRGNVIVFTSIVACITGITMVGPVVEDALGAIEVERADCMEAAETGGQKEQCRSSFSTGILLLMGNQILAVFGADALFKNKRLQSVSQKPGVTEP